MIDLYKGDCLEVMKKIESNSVDCLITDPPYAVITGGKNNGKNHKRPKGILNENSELMGNIPPFNDWLKEVYRVMKNKSHGYCMTNTKNLIKMSQEIENVGFKIHNFLVWQKNNCTPSQYYMKNCEYTIFFRKGNAKYINDIGGSKTVHSFNNIIGNKEHPTQKPVDLMEFYVRNSTKENEIVLDPFMGSGTTGVAAKQTNRNFIGIEQDEKYFNIANERINGTLF
tara:strand:+ start:329 stop:1006 length:678 start_codon:yes stop_codon:yes gene_type:complete